MVSSCACIYKQGCFTYISNHTYPNLTILVQMILPLFVRDTKKIPRLQNAIPCPLLFHHLLNSFQTFQKRRLTEDQLEEKIFISSRGRIKKRGKYVVSPASILVENIGQRRGERRVNSIGQRYPARRSNFRVVRGKVGHVFVPRRDYWEKSADVNVSLCRPRVPEFLSPRYNSPIIDRLRQIAYLNTRTVYTRLCKVWPYQAISPTSTRVQSVC